MVTAKYTKEQVLDLIESVPDPEIPVLSVRDLGVVRDVEIGPEAVRVSVTPTYSGCPAMHAIERAIENRLRQAGIENVRVDRVYDEPWTSDWMTDAGRDKLRAFGISPPKRSADHTEGKPAPCPRCGSGETELRSFFGSTACKSLHYCPSCEEPFEAFKCI